LTSALSSAFVRNVESPKSPRRRAAAPLPLLIGFAVFVVAMAYLVASSLTRRAAPTFSPTTEPRGDTLTVDGTDGQRWRYVSLSRGRVLSHPDTAGWEIAVRRYNLIANGDIVDLGPAAFDTVRAATRAGEANSSAIQRWFRYSLLTHLLESNRHVYVVRAGGGPLYKLQIVSYYCPGLTAGCMTFRYAPIDSRRESSLP
jgi:hypothetical protein